MARIKEFKIFSTPTCGYCHMLKTWLTEKKIPFTDINVAMDPAKGVEMIKKTGQMGVPVSIISFEDVKRFYENFGEFISVPYKKENIKNALKRKKEEHLYKNVAKAYFLSLAQYIENKKSFFNIKEITKICDKKPKTIYNAFGKLISKGFIEKVGQEGRFDKLKISEIGHKYLGGNYYIPDI